MNKQPLYGRCLVSDHATPTRLITARFQVAFFAQGLRPFRIDAAIQLERGRKPIPESK
jgi:hypothetical protein